MLYIGLGFIWGQAVRFDFVMGFNHRKRTYRSLVTTSSYSEVGKSTYVIVHVKD